MSSINDLKQQIAELEVQTQAPLVQEQQPAKTDDSVPVRPTTLKDMYDKSNPWNVKHDALHAKTADESLEMPERIAAAVQWRDMLPRSSEWYQYREDELPERLSEHPHSKRLAELKVAIQDESASIKSRFEAIDEHRQLRDEYPKRDIPLEAHVIHHHGYDDAPGRKLAAEIGEVICTAFKKSSSYVAQSVRANRGRDLDCSLADLAGWLQKHPKILLHF